jgi:hypothetical protein
MLVPETPGSRGRDSKLSAKTGPSSDSIEIEPRKRPNNLPYLYKLSAYDIKAQRVYIDDKPIKLPLDNDTF